jgi:hypothetical protein
MTTADEDRIAARRAEAIRLRVRGKTIREIADALQIGVATAHDDVRTAMRETAKQAEDDVQAELGLELRRLERALDIVEKVLTGGNSADPEDGDELTLKALDRLVKIQDQRAKLLGLYAPEKRDINAKVSAVGLDELDEMRRGAEANAACPPTEPEPTDDSEPSS